MGQRIDVNHENIYYGDFLAVEDVNISIEAFRQPSIASPSTPKDVSLKKGTSTKKKKKKSDHVPKESKKETKEVKETKEIVEKKKPEKKRSA